MWLMWICLYPYYFSSIMSNSLQPHGLQHTRLLSPPLSPGVCSNSYPLSQWCYLTSHLLLSTSPLAFSLSQYQSLVQWVGSLHQVAKVSVLPVNIQGWLPLGLWLVGSPCSPRDSQESSPTPWFKSINSLALSLLYGPTLTSIRDYWKNHSFDFGP